MKVLDPSGKPLRRVIGFHEQEPVPDEGALGAVSGTVVTPAPLLRWRDLGSSAPQQEPQA